MAESNDESKLRGWLEGISFAHSPDNAQALSKIDAPLKRLRHIYQDGAVVGLAALSTSANDDLSFLSAQTVGGFITTSDARGSNIYYGVMDYEPMSAKRDARQRPRPSKEILNVWAGEQIELIKQNGATDFEWVCTNYSLSDLDLDPLPVFKVLLRLGDIYSVADDQLIISVLRTTGIAVFKSTFMEHIEMHHQQTSYANYPLFWPVRNGSYLSLEMSEGKPTKDYSFLGCLFRLANLRGHNISLELRKGVAASYMSGSMDAYVIKIVD